MFTFQYKRVLLTCVMVTKATQPVCMDTLSLSTSPMNRLSKILSFLLFFIFSINQTFGQETDCSNGLDDDGDNFVDCYDSDCAGDNACTEFFFGNNVTCSQSPDVTSFTMNLGSKMVKDGHDVSLIKNLILQPLVVHLVVWRMKKVASCFVRLRWQ